ncbi:hypothetical protein ACFL1H_08285, partial [Nanoarchaeota archaeon]
IQNNLYLKVESFVKELYDLDQEGKQLFQKNLEKYFSSLKKDKTKHMESLLEYYSSELYYMNLQRRLPIYESESLDLESREKWTRGLEKRCYDKMIKKKIPNYIDSWKKNHIFDNNTDKISAVYLKCLELHNLPKNNKLNIKHAIKFLSENIMTGLELLPKIKFDEDGILSNQRVLEERFGTQYLNFSLHDIFKSHFIPNGQDYFSKMMIHDMFPEKDYPGLFPKRFHNKIKLKMDKARTECSYSLINKGFKKKDEKTYVETSDIDPEWVLRINILPYSSIDLRVNEEESRKVKKLKYYKYDHYGNLDMNYCSLQLLRASSNPLPPFDLSWTYVARKKRELVPLNNLIKTPDSTVFYIKFINESEYKKNMDSNDQWATGYFNRIKEIKPNRFNFEYRSGYVEDIKKYL